MDNIVKATGSAFLTIAVYLFGGFDVAMQCLMLAIITDYVTGVIKAYYLKELSSKVGFKGILKKVLLLTLITVAVIVDRIAGMKGMVRTPVIYFFVMNEAISIIENAATCGVGSPKFLSKIVKSLKDSSENGSKDT